MFRNFQSAFAKQLYPDGNIRVLSGPFAGTEYFDEVVWGPITPKWLGSYERELHEIISELIENGGYSTIVVIGASEGYYSVGLARAMPAARVFSFDIDPFSRRLQRKLARLNALTNLRIGRRCSHRDLDTLLGNGGLVISDIEGSEYELLNPALARALMHSDMLVEIHESGTLKAEEVRDAIRERFSTTHHAKVIGSERRHAAQYVHLCGEHIDADVLGAALSEHRNCHQEWLWLKANRTADSD